MIKKTFILFQILCCLIFFTACGNSEEEFDYSFKGLPDTETDSLTDTAGSVGYSVNAYTTIEKAQEAIGYSFAAPTDLPAGYTLDEISVVLNGTESFAQINYKNGDSEIIYRVSATTSDLNSDRTKYPDEREFYVFQTTINGLCREELIYVSTWTDNGFYYCLMASDGFDTTTTSKMIASLQ